MLCQAGEGPGPPCATQDPGKEKLLHCWQCSVAELSYPWAEAAVEWPCTNPGTEPTLFSSCQRKYPRKHPVGSAGQGPGDRAWSAGLWGDTVLCLAPQQCFPSLLCVCCVSFCGFFPGSVSGFLPGCVSGLVTMHSLLPVLSPCLQVCLFIKPAKELQNPSLAERFGFSTEGTWWDSVLPDRGLQAPVPAQGELLALPCPGHC